MRHFTARRERRERDRAERSTSTAIGDEQAGGNTPPSHAPQQTGWYEDPDTRLPGHPTGRRLGHCGRIPLAVVRVSVRKTFGFRQRPAARHHRAAGPGARLRECAAAGAGTDGSRSVAGRARALRPRLGAQDEVSQSDLRSRGSKARRLLATPWMARRAGARTPRQRPCRASCARRPGRLRREHQAQLRPISEAVLASEGSSS